MNFAKNVVKALVVNGRMDEDAAKALVSKNAATVIAGGMIGDYPEDVAHDLFLTIGSESPSDDEERTILYA